jgi:hypothetical protein
MRDVGVPTRVRPCVRMSPIDDPRDLLGARTPLHTRFRGSIPAAPIHTQAAKSIWLNQAMLCRRFVQEMRSRAPTSAPTEPDAWAVERYRRSPSSAACSFCGWRYRGVVTSEGDEFRPPGFVHYEVVEVAGPDVGGMRELVGQSGVVKNACSDVDRTGWLIQVWVERERGDQHMAGSTMWFPEGSLESTGLIQVDEGDGGGLAGVGAP